MTLSPPATPVLLVSAERLDELDRRLERIERALAAAPQRDPQSPPRRRYVGVREAADILGCSERQARRLIARGLLRPRRLVQGGSSRVWLDRTEVEGLLEAST